MSRTITTQKQSFTRPSSVTYSLPTPPYSTPVVTITLPPSSQWTSGLHWHETHTEYLQIISGSALVTLNQITKVFTSSDGIITVPRFARHEWRRATPEGEPLVVKEWTDPADGEKEVFFRNLSSVIEDWVEGGKKAGGGGWKASPWWLTWQLYVVFYGLDNWPVIVASGSVPIFGDVVEWAVTHLVILLAVLVGKVVGLKSVYEEYTPRRVVDVSEKSGKAKEL